MAEAAGGAAVATSNTVWLAVAVDEMAVGVT
jgi:hypothetical protein